MKRSFAFGRLARRPAVLAPCLAGFDPLARGHAALDHLGQLALFLRREQRHQADLVEVLTYRITHLALPNELRGIRIP